jgi:hypothetical protein
MCVSYIYIVLLKLAHIYMQSSGHHWHYYPPTFVLCFFTTLLAIGFIVDVCNSVCDHEKVFSQNTHTSIRDQICMPI